MEGMNKLVRVLIYIYFRTSKTFSGAHATTLMTPKPHMARHEAEQAGLVLARI
jgi:hypothetical protein